MEIGPSFVADRQSAKAIEPGVCPLNDPPMPAQPLARLDPRRAMRGAIPRWRHATRQRA